MRPGSTGLPKAVAQPFYRDQLTSHIAELERQISNLNREIERQSGGLLDQRDTAVDLRQRLKHKLVIMRMVHIETGYKI